MRRQTDPPLTAARDWEVILGVGGGHHHCPLQQGQGGHLLVAVLPDVVGAETGVEDGDEAAAPDLALHHVQQEAELALLPAGVAAAPSE